MTLDHYRSTAELLGHGGVGALRGRSLAGHLGCNGLALAEAVVLAGIDNLRENTVSKRMYSRGERLRTEGPERESKLEKSPGEQRWEKRYVRERERH